MRNVPEKGTLLRDQSPRPRAVKTGESLAGSDAFDAFIADLTRGGEARTVTYGLQHFRALQGEERAQAVELLLRGADSGDLRAVETLGQAGVSDARPLLERLRTRPGELGAGAARALLNIQQAERDVVVAASEAAALESDAPVPPPPTPPQDLASIQAVARAIPSASPLTAAMNAYSLRDQEGEEALRGLLAALESRSVAARANGWFGLKKQLGLAPLLTPVQAPLFAYVRRLRTSIPPLWATAARRLAGLLRSYADGESAADLGLIYASSSPPAAIRAFAASTEGRNPAYDVEAFAQLAGHDRDWALSVLFSALESTPEAGDALVALRIDEAAPILRAAAERGLGDDKIRFTEQLERLEAALSANEGFVRK